MIFLTSDTHFNHKNIIKYEHDTRPFNTIEEMNDVLIERWNSVVTSSDTVYHLGDFFMGQTRKNLYEEILSKLNGKIHLIIGNHDTPERCQMLASFGITAQEIKYLQYKGLFFILCHFPLVYDCQEWINNKNKEIILCYGHVHSQAPVGYQAKYGTYHVGVDTNNLTPVSLEQIYQERMRILQC